MTLIAQIVQTDGQTDRWRPPTLVWNLSQPITIITAATSTPPITGQSQTHPITQSQSHANHVIADTEVLALALTLRATSFEVEVAFC